VIKNVFSNVKCMVFRCVEVLEFDLRIIITNLSPLSKLLAW